MNGVIERREWSLPQASCSVTELLRHHQRHTFSALPRDFPLRESTCPTRLFFSSNNPSAKRFPGSYLPNRRRISHATEELQNSHQMSAVHPNADINQPIASA